MYGFRLSLYIRVWLLNAAIDTRAVIIIMARVTVRLWLVIPCRNIFGEIIFKIEVIF